LKPIPLSGPRVLRKVNIGGQHQPGADQVADGIGVLDSVGVAGGQGCSRERRNLSQGVLCRSTCSSGFLSPELRPIRAPGFRFRLSRQRRFEAAGAVHRGHGAIEGGFAAGDRGTWTGRAVRGQDGGGRPGVHRRPGIVIIFLGSSGAGKSTTMRMILGPDAPPSGSVTVDAEPYARHAKPLQVVGPCSRRARCKRPGRRVSTCGP
jgi:hypothetical protein